MAHPIDDDRLTHVRSIAVLRANAVGDFLVTLPALGALRATYPQARITLLGQAWHARFLVRRPGPIDEVVVLPPIKGVGASEGSFASEQTTNEFVAHMRERRFDLALQWHGGGRNSNPFVRSLGARVTAGFATPDAPPLDRTLPYITSLPERLRLIEGARLVGATTTDDDPRLHVTDADRAELASVLPDAPDPLVVIQPGARDPRRRWSARHFAVVADAFAARGARIAINGTEDEAACVNEVCSRMRHDSINLTGRLSLGALAALCEHARLMISNDTGPLHLARAVGTRNVGIYWAGNLITHGPVRSWRDRVAASWRMACPVCECHCMQHDCEHRVSFVDDVHPRDVEALALELYALERNRSLSRSITPNSSHSLPTAY